MPGPALTVELVPSTCWFANVRSEIQPLDWKRLKRFSANAAGNRCQICHGIGPRWPVECHEIWHYNDTLWVQKLMGFISLCPPCHHVKHLGFAESRGLLVETMAHLARVNRWSPADANQHAEAAFEEWSRRSAHSWTLDISYLDQFGIKPAHKPLSL